MKMIVFNHIIHKIGSKIETPEYFIEIDLKNQWILPGLINNHCHLSGSGKPLPKFIKSDRLLKFIQKRKFFKKIMYNGMKKSAMTALMSGTTTVRSLGEADLSIFDLRDRINSGEELGARIFTAGKAIALKGGHGELVCIEITNVEEAKRAVNLLIEKGADCIKIMATGGVTGAKSLDTAGKAELSPEIIKAICDIAHKHCIRVTAHSEGNEGALNCISGGIDSLEHGSNYDDSILKQLQEKSIGTIPTLAAGNAYSNHSRKDTGLTEIEVLNDNRVGKNIDIGLRNAIKFGGILIGAGDDAGIPLVYHGKIAQEISMLHKQYGLSILKCIQCATINNAKIMGREDKLGSLDVGKFADFIVFAPDKNPLDNVDLLFHPDSVYKEGVKIR
jgi:imidazolonepropionase-like amidohydrolase